MESEVVELEEDSTVTQMRIQEIANKAIEEISRIANQAIASVLLRSSANDSEDENNAE